jgi:hypothetical protein
MQSSGQGGMGSPISNEAYNVLTALQSKLEALEAYRTYAKDGQGDLWRQLSEQDMQSVDRLLGELERLVQGGQLRTRSGKAA